MGGWITVQACDRARTRRQLRKLCPRHDMRLTISGPPALCLRGDPSCTHEHGCCRRVQPSTALGTQDQKRLPKQTKHEIVLTQLNSRFHKHSTSRGSHALDPKMPYLTLGTSARHRVYVSSLKRTWLATFSLTFPLDHFCSRGNKHQATTHEERERERERKEGTPHETREPFENLSEKHVRVSSLFWR